MSWLSGSHRFQHTSSFTNLHFPHPVSKIDWYKCIAVSVKFRQMLLEDILNPINEESCHRKTIISERYDSSCPTFMFVCYSSLITYQQFKLLKLRLNLSGICKTSGFMLPHFSSLVYLLQRVLNYFRLANLLTDEG